MISTSQSKLIRSLRQKKFRDQHHIFLLEGEKMVLELISGEGKSSFPVRDLFATAKWIDAHKALLQSQSFKVIEATMAELKKVSMLVTPQPVIALVSMPEPGFSIKELIQTPVLAFESIRDPGNLGTIIRTADWFGISHIVCTPDSTDLYNPKVVQSTMGAITRVKVHYLELESLLKSKEMQEKTIFGTFLKGKNIYESSLDADSLILFGNESHGLSKILSPYIRHRISIPSFSPDGKGSESLTVASSVAVVCSELRRR